MHFLKIFTDYRQFQIFILGIYSGMPLFIIYSTLIAWLKTADLDITLITSCATARVFYSLKIFWAPIIDQIKLPMLGRLGRRKSWMSLLFAIIALIIYCYSQLNPHDSFIIVYVLTLCLGFASASLDIVIDAYRIETVSAQHTAVAAANAIFGYRIGGLIASVSALYIAADYGWSFSFSILSILYLLGIIFVLLLSDVTDFKISEGIWNWRVWKNVVVAPIADFLSREYAIMILVAITFYKLGEAMLGVVAIPFYLDIGFTLKEIVAISKVFGLVATICGSYLGGAVVYRYGSLRGLIICGLVQSITNLSYLWLLQQGHNTNALIITITIDNIAAGMGDAALIGYLGLLCNKNFSATQYALLSSATGLFSHTIVGFAGSILNLLGWQQYFIMTVWLAIPGLLMLIYLQKKIKQ